MTKKQLTEKRLKKFKEVARLRQDNITVVLENVHSVSNISAVLRTCDAVGINEIYVLYSQVKHKSPYLRLGKRSSAGSRRWVDVHFFEDTDLCLEAIRKKYKKILVSHVQDEEGEMKTPFEMDLTQSFALVFGNEHHGITESLKERCDGFFTIPMVGMVSSLNVSVACSVVLYESFRQRRAKGYFHNNIQLKDKEQTDLLKQYISRQHENDKRKSTRRIE